MTNTTHIERLIEEIVTNRGKTKEEVILSTTYGRGTHYNTLKAYVKKFEKDGVLPISGYTLKYISALMELTSTNKELRTALRKQVIDTLFLREAMEKQLDIINSTRQCLGSSPLIASEILDLYIEYEKKKMLPTIIHSRHTVDKVSLVLRQSRKNRESLVSIPEYLRNVDKTVIDKLMSGVMVDPGSYSITVKGMDIEEITEYSNAVISNNIKLHSLESVELMVSVIDVELGPLLLVAIHDAMKNIPAETGSPEEYKEEPVKTSEPEVTGEGSWEVRVPTGHEDCYIDIEGSEDDTLSVTFSDGLIDSLDESERVREKLDELERSKELLDDFLIRKGVIMSISSEIIKGVSEIRSRLSTDEICSSDMIKLYDVAKLVREI